MASTDSYGDFRRKNRGTTKNQAFAATDGNLTLITGKAGFTLYVQRLTVIFKTSAAQAVTFEDNTGGTPVYVAKVDPSPAVDSPYVFDFGPKGTPIGSGKNLMQDMTAGNAGHTEVHGYWRQDTLGSSPKTGRNF